MSRASALDCKGGGRAPGLPDSEPMGGSGGLGGRGGSGGTQNGGSSGSGDEDAGVEDAGFDAAGANCGVATCRGAGRCTEVEGRFQCVCDPRYTLLDNECVVATVVNRISIGISSDIDDVELSRVGPQGSFLMPQPTDWAQAFQSVVERGKELPRRAYLLTYCSPAVAANHEVAVTLANLQTAADATCRFNANTFGVGVGSCNAQFVSSYCDSRTCGSFLACRACAVPDAGEADQDDDDL